VCFLFEIFTGFTVYHRSSVSGQTRKKPKDLSGSDREEWVCVSCGRGKAVCDEVYVV
jgi:hypothetical protein